MIGPISLARKIELPPIKILSLRRHDPDQVQRVPAVPPVSGAGTASQNTEAGGLSAPYRSSPRNRPNVGRQAEVSTRLGAPSPRALRGEGRGEGRPQARSLRVAAPHPNLLPARAG